MVPRSRCKASSKRDVMGVTLQPSNPVHNSVADELPPGETLHKPWPAPYHVQPMASHAVTVPIVHSEPRHRLPCSRPASRGAQKGTHQGRGARAWMSSALISPVSMRPAPYSAPIRASRSSSSRKKLRYFHATSTSRLAPAEPAKEA